MHYDYLGHGVAERVGFEPTVAKGYTRSPGAPVRPLQHLSSVLAERVGFEPTLRKAETAFRERHHQPLGHLSKTDYITKMVMTASYLLPHLYLYTKGT